MHLFSCLVYKSYTFMVKGKPHAHTHSHTASSLIHFGFLWMKSLGIWCVYLSRARAWLNCCHFIVARVFVCVCANLSVCTHERIQGKAFRDYFIERPLLGILKLAKKTPQVFLLYEFRTLSLSFHVAWILMLFLSAFMWTFWLLKKIPSPFSAQVNHLRDQELHN